MKRVGVRTQGGGVLRWATEVDKSGELPQVKRVENGWKELDPRRRVSLAAVGCRRADLHQQGNVRSTSLSSLAKLKGKPVDTEELDLGPKVSDSKGQAGQRRAKTGTWAASGSQVSGE